MSNEALNAARKAIDTDRALAMTWAEGAVVGENSAEVRTRAAEATLLKILADGKVTPDERAAGAAVLAHLQKAVCQLQSYASLAGDQLAAAKKTRQALETKASPREIDSAGIDGRISYISNLAGSLAEIAVGAQERLARLSSRYQDADYEPNGRETASWLRNFLTSLAR